jgi:hypothetical protein
MPADPVQLLESKAPLAFGVTVLRNRSDMGRQIDSYSLSAGETTLSKVETGMMWPETIYSMSHIAVPFRPDDPVYGDGAATDGSGQRIVFGNLAPRGEEGVLRLNSAYFLRTRYNPFFAYQAQHLENWLATLDQSAESSR